MKRIIISSIASTAASILWRNRQAILDKITSRN